MNKKYLYSLLFAFLLATLGVTSAAAQNNLNNPNQPNNLNLSSPFQQGTWLPVLSAATTNGTMTYSTQSGTYEIIGRQVTARFSIIGTLTNGTTYGGALQITGLPISSTSSTGDYGTCNIDVFSGLTLDSGYGSLAGVITAGTQLAGIMEVGSAKSNQLLGTSGGLGSATMFAVTATPVVLIGNCMYRNP